MAGNTVEILVKSRDEAKPDLEDLKAKLEELSHKVAQARVEVEDHGDAAKLDRMSAKLLELDRKTANPKIRVAGALRAEADIHAVEASLDNLNRKEDETAAKTALLGDSFGGIAGKLTSFGDSIPLPAIAALIPVIGAVAVEVLGVASGFAAAGAGAVAFGALAMPAVKQVEAAYSGLNAAQQKYQKALDLQKLDPTKAHAAAVKAALDQLNLAGQAIGKLPADEQKAVDGLYKLRAEFGKLSAAFAPQAFKVFADGLKIVSNLLPAIVPFANTFANVLDSLLKQAAKFTASKGFADWLKQFHSLEGPALNSIGQGIGKVAVAIGKLLTIMSGKDVAHAINILFGSIATTINVVASGIHRFMENWDSMSRTATRDAHEVASSFDVIRHGAAALAGAVVSTFKQMGNAIASWVADVAHYVMAVISVFKSLPGRILGALGNLGSLLINAGRAVIEGLIHGIESGIAHLVSVVGKIAGIIAAHKGPLEADLLLLVPHGRAIMQGLMDGMRSRYGDLRSQLGEVSAMVGTNPWPVPAGRGGGGGVQLQVMPGGGSAFEQFMVMALRNYVRIRGGSVQSVLGH